jgi:hypothetical protein
MAAMQRNEDVRPSSFWACAPSGGAALVLGWTATSPKRQDCQADIDENDEGTDADEYGCQHEVSQPFPKALRPSKMSWFRMATHRHDSRTDLLAKDREPGGIKNQS